jgi:alpha-beta hydrolase superfamily lysophospholipase
MSSAGQVLQRVAHRELTLAAYDGVPLHLSCWSPAGLPPAAQLLVVPGYGEHGGRHQQLARHMARAGIGCMTVDLRGHGRSGGQRGHVRRFVDYHLDVQAALGCLSADEPRFLLGHSHGGLVVLDLLARTPALCASLQGIVLSNPFLAPGPVVPAWKVKLGLLLGRLAPRLPLPSGIPATALCRDPAVVAAYETDPLVFRTMTGGWMRAVHAAQARVLAQPQLPVPVFYLHSDGDTLVCPRTSAALAARLSSPDKQVRCIAGAQHEPLNESGADELHAELAAWVRSRASAAAALPRPAVARLAG